MHGSARKSTRDHTSLTMCIIKSPLHQGGATWRGPSQASVMRLLSVGRSVRAEGLGLYHPKH